MVIEATNPVIVNWTPKLIKQDIAFRSGQTPTAERLNELFNLNIQQGDLNTLALTQLIHDFYGVAEYTDTYYADLDALIAKTNTALNTVNSNVTQTLEIADAKLFELKDKLNLLEVSTNEYQFTVDTHLDEYDGKLDLQAQNFNLVMTNNKAETYAALGVTADNIQALITAGGVTASINASANAIQQTINSVNEALSTSITQQKDRIDVIATNYITAASLSVAIQRDDVTNVLKSVIAAQADEIRLKAGSLVIDSANFTLTEAGTVTCKGGNFENVTITSVGGGYTTSLSNGFITTSYEVLWAPYTTVTAMLMPDRFEWWQDGGRIGILDPKNGVTFPTTVTCNALTVNGLYVYDILLSITGRLNALEAR